MLKKLTFILILTFFSIANSQQLINQNENDEPIEIYADNGIEWHKNDKKYLALGNAKAISGSLTLTSEIIEAYYEEKSDSQMDVKLVKAHKNVKISDDKMKIVGGRSAEYDLKKDFFSIIGDKITLFSDSDELKSNKKMEYWRKKEVAIATGKAVAKKKNEFVIRADKLVWYLKKIEKKINVKKILGFNNVSIETNNEVAFSDKALYNKETEICKLFGNVKLKKGDSFLIGDYAEVDLKKGISKLLPAPGQSKHNENRVKALIDKEGVSSDESN